jgi:hypothetical protein
MDSLVESNVDLAANVEKRTIPVKSFLKLIFVKRR